MITGTLHLSTQAAADELNRRGLTIIGGKPWHATHRAQHGNHLVRSNLRQSATHNGMTDFGADTDDRHPSRPTTPREPAIPCQEIAGQLAQPLLTQMSKSFRTGP